MVSAGGGHGLILLGKSEEGGSLAWTKKLNNSYFKLLLGDF